MCLQVISSGLSTTHNTVLEFFLSYCYDKLRSYTTDSTLSYDVVKFAVIRAFLFVLNLTRVFHRSVFETLYKDNFLYHMLDISVL